jgi:hypothetical protein
MGSSRETGDASADWRQRFRVVAGAQGRYVWAVVLTAAIAVGLFQQRQGFMARPETSPYYSDHRRLADVIAALQAMGAYDKGSLFVSDWATRLGPAVSAENWSIVFREHPEFFRLGIDAKEGQEYASLRWRHAQDKSYHPVERRELSAAERAQLAPDEQSRLTTKPLEPPEIHTLITTAIELHVRAIAHAQEHRWLTPLLFALLGTIVGALLKA